MNKRRRPLVASARRSIIPSISQSGGRTAGHSVSPCPLHSGEGLGGSFDAR